jgi:uncharacterized membrane protein YedE/YeeE
MRAPALIVGIGFGFVLGWARLTDYDVIHDTLLLRRFDVFLMIGTAVATAAIVARLLRAAKTRSLVGGEPIAWSITRPTRNHVTGSVLFGLGWALSGTCPGPVAAQLGRGQLAALFTFAGILAGVALFGYIQRWRDAAVTAPRATELGGSAEPGL